MAVIPSRDTTVLSGTSTDILNAIRNELGGGYARVVPLADGTSANLELIGNAILGNAEIRNSFIGMINAIGLTIVKSATYYNEWQDLKLGTMELGELVREAFVQVVMPKLYNPNAGPEEYFSADNADVENAIHYINYRTFYKIPIDRVELRKAFSYSSGVVDMINRIIEQAEVAEQFDEYIAMRYVIARCIADGRAMIEHIDPIDKTTAEDVAIQIKAVSDNLRFMSTDYNEAGVLRTVPKDQQLVIFTPLSNAVQDVAVLAKSFNENRVEWSGVQKFFDHLVPTEMEYKRLEQLFTDREWYRRFTTDEETLLNSISVIMISKDKLMVLDTLIESADWYNGETLKQFFWFHHHKIMSDSPFGMIIAFTSEELAVTGVTITPNSVTSYVAGNSYQFRATVNGDAGVDKKVTWSISGQTSANTYISESGLLYLGQDETGATITVKATSVFDNTKSGTASVTKA